MDTFEITASTLVFTTPELLEIILSHLSMLDLVRLSSSSHTFHTTIFTSPLLKRKIFLTQPRFSDLPEEIHDYIRQQHIQAQTPSTVPLPLLQPLTPLRTEGLGNIPGQSLHEKWLHPALSRILPGLTTRKLCNDWVLLSFQPLKKPSGAMPTYDRMLFALQRCPSLRIAPAALHIDRTTGDTPSFPNTLLRNLSAGPDPTEAARIEALHSRLTSRRENSPRFGGPGERAPCLPAHTALRLAVARGEASRDGWVWGRSLEFVRNGPAFSVREIVVQDEEDGDGVRIGHVLNVLRGTGWGWWVVRMER